MSADHCKTVRLVLIATIIIYSSTAILSESNSSVPNEVLRNPVPFRNGLIFYKLHGPLTEISRNEHYMDKKHWDVVERVKRSLNQKYRVLRWADHERDVPTEGGGPPPPKTGPAPAIPTPAPAIPTPAPITKKANGKTGGGVDLSG